MRARRARCCVARAILRERDAPQVLYIFGNLGLGGVFNLLPNAFFKIIAIVTIMMSRGTETASALGTSSAGALAAATYSMVVALGSQLKRFTERFNAIQGTIKEWDLLSEFLEDPCVEDASGRCALPADSAWPQQGAIEFRDVFFRCKSRTPRSHPPAKSNSFSRADDPKVEATTVLRGLSFSVAPGTKLGVIGRRGSGKTTLINHILTEKHGIRVCVIENEFGSVDIDTSLVKENMNVAEEIISLDNGCACCTVRGDLVKQLVSLKERRKEFDAVLLETTGLADPAPILQTFDSNPVLQNNYRIDCVATLVDCKFIQGQLDEVRPEGTVNEAVQQVAFADRVVINKVDLVSKEELRSVKDTVYAKRNPKFLAQLGAILRASL